MAPLMTDTPSLLMLVPHEPRLGPRIHRAAQSLAQRYRVTVVSLVNEGQERAAARRAPPRPYPSPSVGPLRSRRAEPL